MFKRIPKTTPRAVVSDDSAASAKELCSPADRPGESPGPLIGKSWKSRVVLAVRRCVYEIQYLVLYAWYRVMGPPRFLAYHKDINVRLLRAFGATVGQNTNLFGPITLHWSWGGYSNLTIGDDVTFNGGTFLDLKSRITLEREVSLGPHVIIMTHNAFNGNVFLESRLARLVGSEPVVIGAGAGIKAAAVVLHGVTIGEEALVAGGAIVSRDVPRRAYVSGVPAVVRRDLDDR
jgi:acetyltransferase-like isoleucine patch superfamily enzyme